MICSRRAFTRQTNQMGDHVPQSLTTPEGRRLAYHASPGSQPGIVFLGGFKSDMTGTKAVYLEDWAKARGRAFLRCD